jgi:pimeloyl-ACP methyl ester carboxylesterase
MPDRIAKLERVTLNGSQQWITIRGINTNKPLLLYLAGGPGGSDLAWTRRYLSSLEQHVILVNWDQPGSGKSYNAVAKSDLAPERYISDAVALTAYLRQRFGQEKIFLMGHSWGTLLGIWLVQRHPEYFHAYVGSAQMVSPRENDTAAYQLALDYLEETGNTKTLDKLKRQGPPPYTNGDIYSQYAAYSLVLRRYAAEHQHNRTAHQRLTLLRDVLFAPEYNAVDKVNYFRGLFRSFNSVYPQLQHVNLIHESRSFKVPIYFVLGRRDVNTMPPFAEAYFAQIEAPRKELVWFEGSEHLPHFEEAERFTQFVAKRVISTTG